MKPRSLKQKIKMALISTIQWMGGSTGGSVVTPPPPPLNRYTDIFIPNTNQTLYYGSSTDFRAAHGIPGTDLVEVEIQGGTYDYFEAHIIKNIKFVFTGGQ